LLFAGAFQVAVAEAFQATAVTESGTEGAALIAAADEAVEAAEAPMTFVAVTSNVFAVKLADVKLVVGDPGVVTLVKII
jgi:hypothetical protein